MMREDSDDLMQPRPGGYFDESLRSVKVISHRCFKCGADMAKTIVYDQELIGWSKSLLLCYTCSKSEEFYACSKAQVLVSDLLEFMIGRAMDTVESRDEEFHPPVDEGYKLTDEAAAPLSDDKSGHPYTSAFGGYGNGLESSYVPQPFTHGLHLAGENSLVEPGDRYTQSPSKTDHSQEESYDELVVEYDRRGGSDTPADAPFKQEWRGTDGDIHVSQADLEEGIRIKLDDANPHWKANSSICPRRSSVLPHLNPSLKVASEPERVEEQKEFDKDDCEEIGKRFFNAKNRQCSKCNKTVGLRASAADHILVCWKDSVYKCDLCQIERTFESRHNLTRHFHGHHKAQVCRKYSVIRKDEVKNGLVRLAKEKYQCQKCKKIVTGPDKFSHELICLMDLMLYCIFCRKELHTFTSIRSLMYHIKEFYKGNNSKDVRERIGKYLRKAPPLLTQSR